MDYKVTLLQISLENLFASFNNSVIFSLWDVWTQFGNQLLPDARNGIVSASV